VPQSVQTKCNKRGHVILLLEAEDRNTALGGNYTEPLWQQTLAKVFQNDQNNISDSVHQDWLVQSCFCLVFMCIKNCIHYMFIRMSS